MECIGVKFYGWLAHSDADTSSQVSFGGKTPRFQTKSRVSPCFGSSQGWEISLLAAGLILFLWNTAVPHSLPVHGMAVHGPVSDQVKSLAMFWAESRVGKRFRASNMLMHCNEVQWLNSPVFVHGDLLWLPCWSNLAKQCGFGTESCLGSTQGWEIGVLAAGLILCLWKYCCFTCTEVAVHGSTITLSYKCLFTKEPFRAVLWLLIRLQ